MKKTLFTLLIAAGCMTADAQLSIELQQVTTGLSGAVGIAHANDNRLFIVRQPGIISVLDANYNASVFLDIQSKVDDGGNEEGLLGLAFHPDYANNGYFYVNYTASGNISRIERYQVTGAPNVADPNSGFTILEVSQPFSNHNAGDLLFGADGYLYIPWGDGGSGGDPGNRAQNMNNPMGKLYRIDVDNGTPYSIPATNPYPNSVDTLPEIWGIGLRNPWRVSFDRLTNDLWIGDVGQNAHEEVDFWPASMGNTVPNFGWRCYEAYNSYNTSGCQPQSAYVDPVAAHVTSFSNWCSVIGGHVYRGTAFPSMYGHYIYTDYCKDDWYSLEDNGAQSFTQTQIASGTGIFSIADIGENSAGELFAVRESSGRLYRICPDEAPVLSIDGNGVLSSTSAVSYSWFLNGQAISDTTQTLDPAGQGGSYYVVANTGNGCTFQSNSVMVSGTGVSELELNQLNLFPNPANDVMWITLNEAHTQGAYTIVDAKGSQVAVASFTSNNFKIDTAQLPIGHYNLMVASNDKELIRSFVVRR